MNNSESATSTRLATLSDLPALLQIEQSAFPRERWASEADLLLRLELPDSATWIAFYNGTAAGFSNGFPIGDRATQEELDPRDSVLYQRHSPFWLLRNLAVQPSLQGKHLGKRLIQLQLESARAYGAKCVRFTTTQKLASGAELLGFRLVQAARSFHGVEQGVWQRDLP